MCGVKIQCLHAGDCDGVCGVHKMKKNAVNFDGG